MLLEPEILRGFRSGNPDEKRLDSTAERLYNDMKKKSITIALAAVLAVGLGSSVLFSAARFGVANPFSVLAGLYQAAVSQGDARQACHRRFADRLYGKPGLC